MDSLTEARRVVLSDLAEHPAHGDGQFPTARGATECAPPLTHTLTHLMQQCCWRRASIWPWSPCSGHRTQGSSLMRRYGAASQSGGTFSAMSAPLSGVYYAGGSATAALYGGRRGSGGGAGSSDGGAAVTGGGASAAAGSGSGAGGPAGTAHRALRHSAHDRGDSAHGATGPAASPIDVRMSAH